MYRALSEFISAPVEMYDFLPFFSSFVLTAAVLDSIAHFDSSQVANRVSKTSNSSDPIIFNRIEVIVDTGHGDTAHRQHSMSQMGLDGSSISVDEQPDEKLHRLSLDRDAEKNV